MGIWFFFFAFFFFSKMLLTKYTVLWSFILSISIFSWYWLLHWDLCDTFLWGYVLCLEYMCFGLGAMWARLGELSSKLTSWPFRFLWLLFFFFVLNFSTVSFCSSFDTSFSWFHIYFFKTRNKCHFYHDLVNIVCHTFSKE